jgi:hypothetical protein
MIKYNSYPIVIDWSLVSIENYENDYKLALEDGDFYRLESTDDVSGNQQKARAVVAMLNIISENKLQEFKNKRAESYFGEVVEREFEDFLKEVTCTPLAQSLLDEGTYPDDSTLIDDDDMYKKLNQSKMPDGTNALIAFSLVQHAVIPANKLAEFKIFISKMEEQGLGDKALTDALSAPIIKAEVQAMLKVMVDDLQRESDRQAAMAAEHAVFSPVNPSDDTMKLLQAKFEMALALEQAANLAAEKEAAEIAVEQAAVISLDNIEQEIAELEGKPVADKKVAEEAVYFEVDEAEYSEEEEEFDDAHLEELYDSETEEAKVDHRPLRVTPVTVLKDAKVEEPADKQPENVALEEINRALIEAVDEGNASKSTFWQRCKQKWNAVPTVAKVAAVVATVVGLASLVLGILCPPSLLVTVPLLKISSSSLMIYAGAALTGVTLLGHATHVATRPVRLTKDSAESKVQGTHGKVKNLLTVSTSKEDLTAPVADISPRSVVSTRDNDKGALSRSALLAMSQNFEDEEEDEDESMVMNDAVIKEQAEEAEVVESSVESTSSITPSRRR